MDLDEVRQMLGCDADFFYSTVQLASHGSAARVFVALFMNRDHWLTLEQISAITDLSVSTIMCHAIPILKRLGLVKEKEENGVKKYRYVPLLGFS